MVSSKHFYQFIIGLVFYIVLLFSYQLYVPALSGPFFLDDYPNLEVLSTLDRGASWQSLVFDNHSGPFGRAIPMATFVVDYTRGAGGSTAFKTTNLAIHLIIGCTIFWLSIELFELTTIKKNRIFAALLLSALWLTSPLFVSTVLYVVQRMAQISALFMLIGCLCYVKGRKQLIHHERKSSGWMLILVSLLVMYPLALFSKENGLLLPLLLFLIEVVFFDLYGMDKKANFRTAIILGTTAISCVALLILVKLDSSLFSGYEQREFTMAQRLLTQSRILWEYIFHLILPKGDQFGLIHDDYVLSSNLMQPLSTLFSLCFWVISILLSYICLFSNRLKYFSFGLLFFIIGHLLESTVIPLELYFEHRNYLPSFGVYFLIVFIAFLLIQNYKISLMILILPLLFGLKTSNEVYYWTATETLVEKYYHAHPSSGRAMVIMSSYSMNQKDYDKSYEILLELEKLDKYRFGANMQKILLHCIRGDSVPTNLLNDLQKEIATRKNISYPVYESEIIKTLLENSYRCSNWPREPMAKFLDEWARNLGTLSQGNIVRMVYYNASVFLNNIGYSELASELINLAIEKDNDNLKYQLLRIQYLINHKDFKKAQLYLSQVEIKFQKLDDWQQSVLLRHKEALSSNL